VIVGDVEGHDGHAAALMARYSTLLRAACCRREAVDAVIDELREFHASLDSERLVTVGLARIYVASSAVEVASAGHPPPLIRRATGRVEVVDLSADPPIGAPGSRGVARRMQLEPGATLVMFSDGLLDPHADPDDALEMIATLIARSDETSPENLVSVLADYARGHHPSDDVVVLAVTRTD
jgi:serine phosphatase RsbU (regulator of sigma subunit)